MKKVIIVLLIATVLVSGCLQNASSTQDGQKNAVSSEKIAIDACKALCNDALKIKWDFSNGPCLSEATLSWDVNDWVCDIAHNPRQAVDNIKENQCYDYGTIANHFVELTPECEFIKAI